MHRLPWLAKFLYSAKTLEGETLSLLVIFPSIFPPSLDFLGIIFNSLGRSFGHILAVPENSMTLESFGRVCGIALENSRVDPRGNWTTLSLVFYPDVGWIARDVSSFRKSVGIHLSQFQTDLEELQLAFRENLEKGYFPPCPPTPSLLKARILLQNLETERELSQQRSAQEIQEIKRMNEELRREHLALKKRVDRMSEGKPFEIKEMVAKHRHKLFWTGVASFCLIGVLIILLAVLLTRLYSGPVVPNDTNGTSPTYPNMVVFYRPGSLPPQENVNEMLIKILNNHTEFNEVPLEELSLRFYFSISLPPGEGVSCQTYFAGGLNLSSIAIESRPLPDRQNANWVTEINFRLPSMTLIPNDSIEHLTIQCHSDSYKDFNYSLMYSYRPSLDFLPWERITLHRGAELLWGVEPPSKTP